MFRPYRNGTRLVYTSTITVISYDDEQEAYMVRDNTGTLMQVDAVGLHDGDWVEQADA